MKKLRVLVLMHEDLVPPASIEGLPEDVVHRFKGEWDVLCALEDLGHEVHPLGVGDELVPIRRAIEGLRPHLAFNLLRAFHGIGFYDAYVTSFLELLKTPYTGSNPRGLLLANDKALSKKLMTYHRVSVPGFAVFRRGRHAKKPPKVRFPLIVKTVREHASLGIAQASIVHDDAALADRVTFVHDSLGVDAIAEEYIEGRELTVGVLGNQRLQAFAPWEMTFDSLPDRAEPIATARMKWDLEYQKKVGLKTAAAVLDETSARAMARIAKRVYRALELSGFARIDLRMDAEGRAYVLEANPNPDLCFGEDFAESADHAGIGYSKLIQRILSLGLSYRPAWKE